MAVPIPKLTPEEYLEIERKAEYKSEYFNGEMFAMAGGAPNHHRLAFRMNGLLFKLLDGRDCEAFTSDAKVRTHPRGLYTYPDLTVVCGKATFAADQRDVLTNPKVIFELLSPSTEAHDRGLKFQQYKLIDSLQEYVLISQFEPLVESFSGAGFLRSLKVAVEKYRNAVKRVAAKRASSPCQRPARKAASYTQRGKD